MKISQEIQVNQTFHQIQFTIGDIKIVKPFDRSMCSAYFIPECSKRDCYGDGCSLKNNCMYCNYKFKLEELLVDGFYVKDDSYIAFLQTGIRVPVNKEIYEAYIVGFEQDSCWSNDMNPIIIK